MKARYYGKKVVKNEFGDVTDRFPPTAVITCKESKREIMAEILGKTGYSFDMFGDDTESWAYVAVADKEDYNNFMELWKHNKKLK